MSAYETLSFKITGVAPLLMHNGQLADPLNPFSQSIAEVTKKRKKTDADHVEMARREFFGGLYISGGAPCIPAEMIEAALIKGAMKEKRGPAAKAGLLVEQNAILEYDGPREPKALWQDERFRLRVAVKVGQAKVMRTRPRFDGWHAAVEVKFLPSLLNRKEVGDFLATAGEQIGIGDWRPRFGRFLVEGVVA
ncbi:hypothetical protein M0638_25015 [Roseomonas sp. NAR14]|uniref:Uncharacterized protein n=1 Tax=Roseomonas acroporae TaxID=2937791 RepID=A0A9X2BWF8_9PROT|nr:hypothetical protein [Roseomonas acroporae]MCK8787632.1 hypothetical protein [Roseomonas acroporae]